jgi:hypothetical protein
MATKSASTKPKSPRATACAHVYRKFRDLKGAKPTVRPAGPNKVFTFKRSVSTGQGGPSLNQIVRVTVNPAGKIVKVVASR